MDAAGDQLYLFPSKEVQEDIDGELVSIPIKKLSAATTAICEAIEQTWLETQHIEDAWDAGCRAFDTARMLWAYIPKGNKHKESAESRRGTIRTGRQNRSRVVNNMNALANIETKILGLSYSQRRQERLGQIKSILAFAKISPNDSNKLVWLRLYSTNDLEEPKHRKPGDLRDPYNRDPLGISVEGKCIPYL